MKEHKTNAMRIVEQKGVSYTPHHYESGPLHVSGEEVAKSLGLPPARVFKTLLTRGASGHYVFVIPSDSELHLKKAAAVCGEKDRDASCKGAFRSYGLCTRRLFADRDEKGVSHFSG